MGKVIILLILLLLNVTSWGQEHGIFNSLELNIGLQSANAKYPNGVGVGYASGATEDQAPGLGWFFCASKPILIKGRFLMEPGVSLASYSYLNKFNYPPDYTDPRIIDKQYSYLFTSLDYKVLFKIFERNKIQIYPYAGFALNINLMSKVRLRSDINGQSVTSYLNFTDDEEKINFNYEAGFKLIFPIKNQHSITSSLGYYHFFKEQYDIGPGKLLYSFRFGLGYTL